MVFKKPQLFDSRQGRSLPARVPVSESSTKTSLAGMPRKNWALYLSIAHFRKAARAARP